MSDAVIVEHIFYSSNLNEAAMSMKTINIKIAISVTLVALALCFIFWFKPMIIGGNIYDGHYPIFMHPYWWDGSQPDISTLTFKKSLFHEFRKEGHIKFYVRKYAIPRIDSDGITMLVFADGMQIASITENPYANPDAPYTDIDKNLGNRVSFNFSIPSKTKHLTIQVLPNENPRYDNVVIENTAITETNTIGIGIVSVLLLLLLFLLSRSIMPLSWKIFTGIVGFSPIIYVGLNINLMPLILLWILWKSGLYEWLCRLFGKNETNAALIIALCSAVFFIVMMLCWRVAVVMDVLYGDSTRIFGDFTQIAAYHYRADVHPFYVLIWQSLYHLFAPLYTTSSMAIRTMIAVFAGINVGLFSLLFSRVSKNIKLNVLICTILAVSFPMVYHGAQMLEGYIFTQTSILLCFLYFSYAFALKRHRLWELLALSLFIVGNNLAYVSIFAIFYAMLLWTTFATMKERLKNAIIFSVWFLLLFSILLLIQVAIYGSTPAWIGALIQAVINGGESRYINIKDKSWLVHIRDMIRLSFVFQTPFVGNMLPYSEWFGILLLAPLFALKKIESKQLFFCIVLTCLFLIIFHRYYGLVEEMSLYAPVIGIAFFALMIYAIVCIPPKIAVVLASTIASVLLIVNLFGAYNAHRLSSALYGKNDIVRREDYQDKEDIIQKHIKCYLGPNILAYRAMSSEFVCPQIEDLQ